MERDSRQGVSASLSCAFAELTDGKYRAFVALWGDAKIADAQLASTYGILGGRSAIELLRMAHKGFGRLPVVARHRRRFVMHRILEAHTMNRAGVYA
jgi:hypothetical protein